MRHQYLHTPFGASVDGDGTFEDGLIAALEPIRGMATAIATFHFFETGLYNALKGTGKTLQELALKLGFDEARLEALLRFLKHDGLVTCVDTHYTLSDRALTLQPFRPWYQMLVGGYTQTFLEIGPSLARGGGPATRDGGWVGEGSCGISEYDSIPVVHRLCERLPRSATHVLDIGCGSGAYIVDLCSGQKALRGVGIEPDPAGYERAVANVARRGLADRVELVCQDAVAYMQSRRDPTDLGIIAFVLHEVLGTEGEAGVRSLLTAFGASAPGGHLLVIEVDDRNADEAAMKHGLAQNYYAPYFLLHPFTRQTLCPESYWDDLFADCGFRTVAKERADPSNDSTGFCIGWLLRREG